MRAGLCLALLLAPQTCVAAQTERYPVVLYVMRVRPDPQWEAIYREVERCVGQTGQLSSVKWYVTDRPVRGDSIGSTVGEWRIRADGYRQIIVMRGDTATIRHEILHDVLWVSGWRPDDMTPLGTHPVKFFGPCAVR